MIVTVVRLQAGSYGVHLACRGLLAGEQTHIERIYEK